MESLIGRKVVCNSERRSSNMRAINDGDRLTLELSFEQAAIIVEALREYRREEAEALLDTMLNKQEVRAND